MCEVGIWHRRIDATICRTRSGDACVPFCQEKQAREVGLLRTTFCFLNAVFWILRTGAPWRDLPPDYGDWKNTHRRFCRWRDRGVWECLLDSVIDEPNFEWLMIDASYIKVHPHGAGARGGNQAMARTKGG